MTTTSCKIHKCRMKNLTIFKFEPPTPNMCPNARNMLHPTMLRYVALKCYDRLARGLRLQMFFFGHLFHIGWPCKHCKFQTCLRDNLVPRMLEMAFQSFQISKFSGGPCPQTPLGLRGLMAPCSYSRLLFSNQLPTSYFIETPACCSNFYNSSN